MNSKQSLVLAALASVLLARTALAWHMDISGGGMDEVWSVAMDDGGNVIAAGYTTGANGKDFTVSKRAADGGAAVWPSVVIDGSAHGDDEAKSVVVDAAGDIVVGGYTTNTTSGRDFAVVKLSGQDGHELWRQELNGTAASTFDEVSAVALDAAGNVVAVGFTVNTGTIFDLTIVKLAGATGVPLWPMPVLIDGTAHSGDFANAVAVDAAGNILVAGFLNNTGTDIDFTILKRSGADGSSMWAKSFDGSGSDDDEALSVAVDNSNNVLVAGAIGQSATGRDFTVMKLAGTDGSSLWPEAVTIDGTGTGSEEDEATAVAVDPEGNAVVVGQLVSASTEGEDVYDFTVVELAAADGAERWRTVVAGTTAGVSSRARAVALDPAGNVFAAGNIDDMDTGSDFVVAELAGTDGHEFWREVLTGDAADLDAAHAVAADRTGNVAAGGRLTNGSTGADFAIVRLGCTGAEPVECIGDETVCRGPELCDPFTESCLGLPKPDGTACNDGNACSRTDVCQAGACAGTPVLCPAPGPCRVGGTCDAVTGECPDAPAPDGTACSDGSTCTTSDSCQAGTCTVDDFEGATCAVNEAPSASPCAGVKLPRGVKRGLKKAGAALTKASSATDVAKRDRFLGKASTALTAAGRAVDKAARKRKKPLPADCAAALRAAIGESQSHIERLRTS